MATLKRVAVLWAGGPVRGNIRVIHGRLVLARVPKAAGHARGRTFSVAATANCRLSLDIAGAIVAPGAGATCVTVRTHRNPFSFFLRDVSAEFPIWIPEYRVAVTTAADRRSYQQIAEAIRSRGLLSDTGRVEAEPEESYEAACRATRDQVCPIWLGVGRDIRYFEMAYSPEQGFWGCIEPKFHVRTPSNKPTPRGIPLPSPDNPPQKLTFALGKGAACEVAITRRLVDGALPILTSVQREGDVAYHLTAFATLERQPLSARAVRGTDWRVAYANAGGNRYTEADLAAMRDLLGRDMYSTGDDTICCIRVQAINSGSVPRHAWLRSLRGEWATKPASVSYCGKTGFVEADERVCAIHRLDGQPMPQPEMAVLIPPGKSVTMEMIIPHQPLPTGRARALAGLNVDAHLSACREYWRAKLRSAAQVRVPEQAVDERIQAGLLHCDLIAFGREPSGTVMAACGTYDAIGSESAPIIQFFDSMGWHGLAERSIQFFLDRQRDDGFMQNHWKYELETGPVLWTMGEHYRYTRDRAWLRRVRGNILRACDYLLKWRNRNKRADLRGKGFGLQEGQVCDPIDPFRSFMLNGVSYLGIARSAEMLADIDPANASRLAREARAYRRDIRIAFRESLVQSPVIPTGDGTWTPTAPPWAGHRGPVSLYAEPGEWWTHNAFGSRDSLTSVLWLPMCEVFGFDEVETSFVLRSHAELFTHRNVGMNQPHYCRHDYAHLRRGEVKSFLKTYYNEFAAQQDRQSYTFWEDYGHCGPHKTHEEGWFLMQTRWMLLLEAGRTLHMLRGVPRAWLEDGRQLSIDGMKTHFGSVALAVRSRVRQGLIEATYTLDPRRKPDELILRLPHPEGLRANEVRGGRYDASTEAVQIANPPGRAAVVLRF